MEELKELTISDVICILLDRYNLSDLEYGLGSTIEDLQHGLDRYVIDNYTDLVSMINEDHEDTRWDN